MVQEINAEVADPTIAQALKVDLNSPVLRIHRLLHNNLQEPIQFLTVWSTPTRSRMLMELPAKDVNTLGAGYLLHDLQAGM